MLLEVRTCKIESKRFICFRLGDPENDSDGCLSDEAVSREGNVWQRTASGDSWQPLSWEKALVKNGKVLRKWSKSFSYKNLRRPIKINSKPKQLF